MQTTMLQPVAAAATAATAAAEGNLAKEEDVVLVVSVAAAMAAVAVAVGAVAMVVVTGAARWVRKGRRAGAVEAREYATMVGKREVEVVAAGKSKKARKGAAAAT